MQSKAKSYAVKELYYTLQGEGVHTGRPAVFLRFAGCNLWNGLEADRQNAICSFCDTDFVGIDGPGGGRFSDAQTLAQRARLVWDMCLVGGDGVDAAEPLLVCTGGEPALQLDEILVSELQRFGFAVAIETNGTLPLPAGLDWICVSPKAGTELVVQAGDELKLVFPQAGAMPESYTQLNFRHFSLQPMDDERRAENAQLAAAYCLKNPRWRLSLQTHKVLGLP